MAPAAHETFFLKSSRIILKNRILDGALLVENGKIAAIVDAPSFNPKQTRVIDVGNKAVSPGIVDTHAHINEPGRTEWEGFRTACEAAAAGGITTVVDMPLNSIPATTTVAALRQKMESAAASGCAIDYGFWGGVIGSNESELEPLVRAGVLGFKCFLIDSGVSEFPHVDAAQCERALRILGKLDVPLLAHAELEVGSQAVPMRRATRSYLDYLFSRPKDWENKAIELLVELCEKTGAKAHVVHLSSAEALPILAKAKERGVRISVETCPHYLTLCAEDIAKGATQFKCAPPIREKQNQDALWRGIKDGVIDFVVSDHSPCTPSLKHMNEGDFNSAWGGISSLQFSLSLLWTSAGEHGLGLCDIARLLSSNTAAFAGLATRKGEIAVGKDADLVVWDPDASFELKENQIFHRHKVTPYLNKKLRGKVERTILRGVTVFEKGAVTQHIGAPLLGRSSI